MLPWLLCGALAVCLLALLLEKRLIQKSLDEIVQALEERLGSDTNTLLFIHSRNRHVRALASELNAQLRLLRAQRRRYLNGDRELKEAVTNISHDLRTPLTAICGYLDLLEGEGKTETMARYLALIGNRVEAMKALTEELFRYSVVLSTAEELTLEAVSLKGALEESAAAFYAALREREITPEIEMCEEKVIRSLNRAALARIFGNVLSNALKYSSGDLSITLRETGEIIFANTASGLDGVQVGMLFDRFFSVEAARHSTGLGLAIAKTLVEQMGGTIAAQYVKGRLEIHIFFPAAQGV